MLLIFNVQPSTHRVQREDLNKTEVDQKVKIVELERKLAAARRRNKELEEDLENSRRWSRAWKRAAKSELDVLNVIRNLRRRRIFVGIDGYAAISREKYEEVAQNLENAQQQIEFLERERQRWMENAEFFKHSNQQLRLRLANLEIQPQNKPGQDGRA